MKYESWMSNDERTPEQRQRDRRRHSIVAANDRVRNAEAALERAQKELLVARQELDRVKEVA